MEERNTVIIDDVDILRGTVAVIDASGRKFKLSLGSGFPTITIPYPGERWQIVRNGYSWQLDGRYDTGRETVLATDMTPGDTRIIGGQVFISADSISINKKRFGITYWEKLAITPGTTEVVLEHAPVDIKSILAYNNQSLVDPTTLTLVGKGLSGTFAVGTLIVYYQYIP